MSFEAPQPRRTCLVRSDGRVRSIDGDELGRIDELRGEPGGLVWLDVHDPDAADLDLLRTEFEVHPLAIEDIARRRQRPKLDTYGDQHVLVAYELDALPAEGVLRRDDLAEIHLFAGPGYLVSVRWSSSAAIAGVQQRFAQQPTVVAGSVGRLLYAVLDAIVDGYFPVIDELNDWVEDLEDRLLGVTEDAGGLHELLGLKRTMLELRRVIAPLRDVANALLRREVAIIDDEAVPYFNDLYDHLVRVLDSMDILRDLVAATLDASLAATSNSLNAVMKRLTAVTVVIMLPTLIAGIYGMNFHVMPELSWPWGYPASLALMAALVIAAIVYFRQHGWF